ncbi:DUF6221 family protein [Streptomyces albogriseolus]
MTAQGGDLLAWLESAITRAEDLARAAADKEQDASWSDGGEYGENVHTDGVASAVVVGPWGYLPDATRTYIAANDPASVLRRCTADRKLLELHAPMEDPDVVGRDHLHCQTCAAPVLGELDNVAFPCSTVRALAEGYGWTEETSLPNGQGQSPPNEGEQVT